MLKNKKFLTTLAVVLFIITGYFIYLLITDSRKDENTTPNNSQEENQEESENIQENEVEESNDTETQLPDGWILQESSNYKYSIGVPDKWYFRFFGQTRMIGLDPNPIPEASEYAGVITFSQDDRAYEIMVSQLKGQLNDTTENTVVVNEREWLEVSGVLPEDDIFSPGEKYLHSMISVNGTSYLLTYSYKSEDSSMLEMYKTVRETVSFN